MEFLLLGNLGQYSPAYYAAVLHRAVSLALVQYYPVGAVHFERGLRIAANQVVLPALCRAVEVQIKPSVADLLAEIQRQDIRHFLVVQRKTAYVAFGYYLKQLLFVCDLPV